MYLSPTGILSIVILGILVRKAASLSHDAKEYRKNATRNGYFAGPELAYSSDAKIADASAAKLFTFLGVVNAVAAWVLFPTSVLGLCVETLILAAILLAGWHAKDPWSPFAYFK